MRQRADARRLAAVLNLCALLVGCSSSPHPVVLPARDQIAQLRVSYRGGTHSVEVVRSTKAEDIARALSALANLNSDWRRPWDTPPTPEYMASFHAPAGSVLVVAWIGSNWLGATTLAEMPKATRLRPLTLEQHDSLLRALGVH